MYAGLRTLLGALERGGSPTGVGIGGAPSIVGNGWRPNAGFGGSGLRGLGHPCSIANYLG